jgi:Domain of unknown function (DUF4383)
MAKTVCTLVGVVFIVVGIAGFLNDHLLDTHLSTAHNIVHLASGLLALYFGTKGSLSQAKMFALIFGIVYAGLGVAGFLAHGAENNPSAGVPGPPDERMLKVLPGMLELGTRDHLIHIVIGALFLLAALATKTNIKRAVD